MMNNAWKTLLLRGTEWAAGREVSIPLQTPWPSTIELAEKQSLWNTVDTDTLISLKRYNEPVWQLNLPKVGKPYFHPLIVKDQESLSWTKPEDHPWHYGLWFSWKYINGVNYWEEDRITGKSDGTTKIRKINSQFYEDFSSEINLEIVYYQRESVPQLFEERILKISRPDNFGHYFIDWTSKFKTGPEGVVLERTPVDGEKDGRAWGGYATLGFRFNSINYEAVSIINDNGEKDLEIHKKPTKWIDVSGMLKNDSSKFAGVTIFDNPANPRHPSPGYVINNPLQDSELSFVYTNPALLYEKGIKLDPHEKLILKYRIYVHSGIGNKEELDQIFIEYKINN
jgi:hypothetical protein